jgi:hypothetical protein
LAALTAAICLGSPWVAVSAAAEEQPGADKPRPATFGDCKHENAGVHNGYDCEPEEPEPTGSPT